MKAPVEPQTRGFLGGVGRVVGPGFVAVIAGMCLASAARAQPPLAAGQPLDARLAGGEVDVWAMALQPGAWRVSASQDELDLVLDVRDPSGQALGAVDLPWDRQLAETLLVEVERPGTYQLEVRPRDAEAAAGSYRLVLEPLAAVPQLLTAHRAMTAGARALSHRAAQDGDDGHDSESRVRRAISHYGEALVAWRRLGERRGEATALLALAQLHRRLGELETAGDFLEPARALWAELGEPGLAASSDNVLALVLLRRGEVEIARGLFEGALAAHQELGDPYKAAVVRNNLCLLLHEGGDLEAAASCYREVLPVFERAGARPHLASVHNNLGGVHYLLGQAGEAQRHYQAALALRRERGETSAVAQVSSNLAVLHRSMGDWRRALELYHEVAELRRASGDQRLEATVLNNLGYAYFSLGELELAETHFRQALALRRERDDRRGEAATLTNLAGVFARRADWELALDLHLQALALRRQLDDRRGAGRALVGVGRSRLALGQAAAALAELDQAVELLRDSRDRRREAYALDERGQALAALGREDEALADLRRALELHRQVYDREGEIRALVALAEVEGAEVEGARGRLEEALAHARQAVAEIEALRLEAPLPELRASFLGARIRAYELAIELEMGLGQAGAALEMSERARARGLLDLLAEARAGLERGAAPQLGERRQELLGRLALLDRRRQADAARPGPGAVRAAIDRELLAVEAELDQVETQIRHTRPGAAAIAAPEPIDLEELQAQLDAETTLLQVFLGSRRSWLWVVRPDAVAGVELPAAAVIEDAARAAHLELATLEVGGTASASDGAASGALGALSELVLAPVAARLTTPRLAVALDGALHVVPFGALPAPGGAEPLVVRHEVVRLPSVSALARLRRLPRPVAPAQEAVVLADPIYAADDPRLGALGGPAVRGPTARGPTPSDPAAADPGAVPWQRLPATRLEAEGLAGLLPPGRVRVALGAAASRDAVLAGALRDARVVHLATHGRIDTERPELSALVLSLFDEAGRPLDGLLRLHELYELELDADLVVLSGCRTALGEVVRGEGLVGLTGGFLQAGVPRVLASLWRVEDRATAELMQRFYHALFVDALPPAAALRRAQLSLRAEPTYRDPYYWSGFVLLGDWR